MFGRKSKTCMGCREKIEKSHAYMRYEIIRICKNIGDMYVHKNIGCLLQGLPVVRQQYDRTGSKTHLRIAANVDGSKYTYSLYRTEDDGFNFLTRWNDRHGKVAVYQETRKFFERYKKEKAIVFIAFRRLSKEPEYSIVTLLSIDDPILSGILDRDAYQKRLDSAEKQFEIDMEVRGKDKIEYMVVLTQYVINTIVHVES